MPDNTDPAPIRHTPVSLLIALIKAIRPKQATKNLFVFAAIIFAGRLTDQVALLQTLAAFFLFTAVSGSVYLLNDVLDIEQDKLHPKKSKRPIASGALPIPLAIVGCAALAIVGIGFGFALRPVFGVAVTAYFALQIGYCFSFKHIVLLDVFTIAIGFVLRTVAGGLATHIPISHWLILCSLQLALFLGFGKRRQELVELKENAGKHRKILDEYSLPFLDQMINVVAGVTIVCYSVYSIESESAVKHPRLWVTVPLVIFSVCRYLYLVYQKGWGGAPDEVLLKDRTLQIAIGIWLILVGIIFAFDSPTAFAGWN